MSKLADTSGGKATSINIFSFKAPHMRVFHITWLTFFLCFFGWFGLAPLMPIIRDEFQLTKGQIGNLMIASVTMPIFARLIIGWLCDKIGPRLSYTYLLILGSIPVMLVGLSDSYESFLIFRLAIGVIGASFVISQYHTSVMFAPNIIGTANATVAGWGNLGGGITQMAMPVLFAAILGLGYTSPDAWRIAMVIPGIALFIMGFVYYKYTQDTPEGNVLELRKNDPEYKAKQGDSASIWSAFTNYRVWILFLCYGACFGIEITMDNLATLYFVDNFELSIEHAGIIAAVFGGMNLFARALGGYFSDKVNGKHGIKGRVILLGLFLAFEGMGMMLFSTMNSLVPAILCMIGFAFFVKMSNGVTYSIVPFVNKKAMGTISGIVGAGGNVGAVLAGFVFKTENITYQEGLWYVGIGVIVVGMLAFLLKFKEDQSATTSTEKKTNVSQLETV